MRGRIRIDVEDPRFLRLLADALSRPPAGIPRIRTVRAISLSRRPTNTVVGMTKYSVTEQKYEGLRAKQTITFYSDLLDALSDKAALGVISHELAHAWLNEHVKPERSPEREAEADRLAKDWGFGPELAALDDEAETV